MKVISIIALLFLSLNAFSQSPNVISSKRFLQDVSREDLTRTRWLKNGSSIHAGSSPNPTGNGNSYKYCYKIDSDANILWNKMFRPVQLNDDVYVQGPDSKNDTTVIGGYFKGEIMVDSNIIVRSSLSGIIFLLEKNGNLLKYRIIDGPEVRVENVIFGKNNDYFVYGYFKDSVIIDNYKIFRADVSAKFIARLDINFNCIWLKAFNSGDYSTSISDIKVGINNDIYLCGVNRSKFAFGDSLIYSDTITRNSFIMKLNESGVCKYIESLSANVVNRLFIDSLDEILIYGAFNRFPLVVRNFSYLNVPGKKTSFVLKLDSNGNPILVLPINIDYTGGAFIQSVSKDHIRNQIMVAGTYSRSSLQVGNFNLPASPTSDSWYLFAAAANQGGTFTWAKSFGNANSSFTNGQGGLDSAGNFLLSDTWYAEGLKIGCKTYNSPDSALLNPYLIKLGFCSLSVDSSQVKNPDCFGYTNGQIKAFASSREGPVTYSWGGANTGPVRSGVGSGNYRLIVSDGSCCKDTSFYSLTAPPSVPQPVLFGLDTGIISQVNSFTCQMPDTSFHVRWEVTGGTILSGQGTDSISVFWDSPGQGIVRLVFSNGVNQVCEKDTILPVLVLSNSYQVEKSQLYAYPNPVENQLFVSADRPMSVWITDATGKVLKSEEVNSTEGNLDVSGLSSGLYFLRIENGRILRFLKK